MSSRKVLPNPKANLHVKQIRMFKLLNIYLNHFPKHEKYALSQQIRNSAYAIYAFTVEANKRWKKKTTLTNLDIEHEKLRMFIKLAFELGYFEFKDGKNKFGEQEAIRRYKAISVQINEIGAMIGGWINNENI